MDSEETIHISKKDLDELYDLVDRAWDKAWDLFMDDTLTSAQNAAIASPLRLALQQIAGHKKSKAEDK